MDGQNHIKLVNLQNCFLKGQVIAT